LGPKFHRYRRCAGCHKSRLQRLARSRSGNKQFSDDLATKSLDLLEGGIAEYLKRATSVIIAPFAARVHG
jgi:hypothetical protein